MGGPKHTLFSKAKPRPGPGRPRKNPIVKAADKIIKAYAKQHADSFLEACEKLLPDATDRISEIVKKKGMAHAGHHIRATELLTDRLYGKPAQAITGAGGGPLLVSFQQVLGHVDGSKKEKI